MYSLMLFAAGIMAVGAQAASGAMPECERIAHGGFSCCKKTMQRIPPPDDIKECFQMAKKPPSCDLEICIAKKHGIASDDGTIDKKKLTEDIEKKFQNEPELVKSLKENCIDGDLSKYGPSDMCDLMKQKFCFEVQFMKNCDDWNEEGDCSGMKELAKECVKQFS